MMVLRETGAGGRAGFSCSRVRPIFRVYPARAVPLAAFIPSRDPGRGRGAWGGSASGEAVRRGQSRGRPRRRVTAGQNALRPRALPPAGGGGACRPPRPGGGRLIGGLGQAADLPVAHPVVDEGEEPAGGGDLGDVLGLLPAAGDDGVFDGSDHAVAGDALDGLDQRPAHSFCREPCLVTWPRVTLVSDSRCRGVSPAHEHSCPAFLNRVTSPISPALTPARTRPTPARRSAPAAPARAGGRSTPPAGGPSAAGQPGPRRHARRS